MRTISKRTKYALRALYSLTRQYGGGPVLIATLAREERIPLKFLEAILLELKTHGFVASRKGRHGGYQLNRSPSQITIGSVVRVVTTFCTACSPLMICSFEMVRFMCLIYLCCTLDLYPY